MEDKSCLNCRHCVLCGKGDFLCTMTNEMVYIDYNTTVSFKAQGCDRWKSE